VTGGCGFIGSSLVRALVREGASVRVLDDLSLGRREDIAGLGVEVIRADIRDGEAVAAAMRDVGPVIHLAAHTRVVASVQDPALDFDVNVRGTFTVLQAARRAGVETVIFASTGGAIMGEQEPPAHEEMVPRPVAPYGAGKLAGEAYCSAFAGAYGLRTVGLRFTNVYGPLSWHKGSVVAKVFRQVLAGEPIVIYGDGRQTRDFLYVGDVCRGIRLAVDYGGPGGEVFHLGSGRETSVAQLIDAIAAVVAPRRLRVTYEPARRGEVARSYASIAKATKVLGFTPEIDLEEGLMRTWEWFQEVWAAGLRPVPAE
jgi:UDP-glucose 4-epimerase